MSRVREGCIVELEGSDTRWRVVEVRKNKMDVVDEWSGVICLDDVDTSEVSDVVGLERDA